LIVGSFALAAVFLALFGYIETRRESPMLPLSFFRIPTFTAANVVAAAVFFAMFGSVFFLSLYLQTVLGYSALQAGATFLAATIAIMIAAPIGGRVTDRIGPRWPIFLGLGIYAAGLLLLSRIGPTSTVVPEVVAAILVFAVGMAVFTAPLATVTLSALDDDEQGVASGMNNAMGQLAGLLAVAILPAIAGLAGVGFGDPAFAAGYGRALGAAALIAIGCMPIAVWAFNVGGAGLPETRGP
jgi:predicted MFS family arabinose efflux permease